MTATFQAIPTMQLFIDLFPILLFFGVYFGYGNIYYATGALMVAMVVQIGWQWFTKKKVSKMLLISGGAAVLLGGATLLLKNPIFVQWKPTVANWLIGLAFIVSRYVGDKTLIERLLGESIEMTKPTWHQLNWIWVANFMILGAANLYVVYNYSEATWVKFKLASIIGFTLFSMLVTMIFVWKHLPKESQEES